MQAVITCVNFSDYLAATLPFNVRYFQRLVVVTDYTDLLTQHVCYDNNVECIQTDVHRQNGNVFNKGRMINLVLDQFDLDGWFCCIDADTMMLPGLWEHLSSFDLDRSTIYGAHRFMCESQSAFDEWVRTDDLSKFWVYRRCDNVPLGYFQLWHSSMPHRYDERFTTAKRADYEFPFMFERRQLIDDCVLHICSEKWVLGKDHAGRKTKPWNPVHDH